MLAIPFWRSDTVLANRFDVGVGGGGTKLGSPFAILKYLARVAGDFTVGWLAVRVVVLLVALVGLVLLARTWRRSAVFVACVLVTPFLFFAATRIGSGMASPESRHLIFVLPFFALLVALPLVRIARNRYGVVLVVVVLVALGAGEIAWGMHNTRTLYVGEAPLRTSSRDAASTWLAATSRPSDILFGYDPLFLGAWEQNRSFSETVVPRADTKLALHVLYQRAEAARPRHLGARRERQQQLHAEAAHPAALPACRHRSSRLASSGRSSSSAAASRRARSASSCSRRRRCSSSGSRCYLGDSDINLLTVERALGTARPRRGRRALTALGFGFFRERLAVARARPRTRRGPPGVVRDGSRIGRRLRAAATAADAPRSAPYMKERSAFAPPVLAVHETIVRCSSAPSEICSST